MLGAEEGHVLVQLVKSLPCDLIAPLELDDDEEPEPILREQVDEPLRARRILEGNLDADECEAGLDHVEPVRDGPAAPLRSEYSPLVPCYVSTPVRVDRAVYRINRRCLERLDTAMPPNVRRRYVVRHLL